MERSYAIPFSEVWDAALAVTGGLRQWQVLTRDSAAGAIRLLTLSPLGHRPLEAEVSLWLDELGQTRIEIAFPERRRLLLPPSGPTRARRFLHRLDRMLGTRQRE